MAAQALARELGVRLFRVDLSQVVSKYVGETEKALDRLFDAAEKSGAMLLFDEADALFGHRSAVKDSHDRYANIEIGNLLRRMDRYEGVIALATNRVRYLDAAFLRRLHVILDFSELQSGSTVGKLTERGSAVSVPAVAVSGLRARPNGLWNAEKALRRKATHGERHCAGPHRMPVRRPAWSIRPRH